MGLKAEFGLLQLVVMKSVVMYLEEVEWVNTEDVNEQFDWLSGIGI